MNKTYKKMIDFLVEARNPNKSWSEERPDPNPTQVQRAEEFPGPGGRVKRLLKKFGKMDEDPKELTRKKSFKAKNQLATHVRHELVPLHKRGTKEDAIMGKVWTLLSKAKTAEASDEERSRQAKVN